jgi:type IX secretion system PorP/SprF family membrane protein
MMKESLLVVIIFVYGLSTSQAQQEILYSQYNFSQLSINPAYAANNDNLSLAAISRKQWIGLEGSPTSVSFFADGVVLGNKNGRARELNEEKVENKKVGLGLIVFNDNLGVSNTFQATLAYSFKINFSSYTRLSFGFQTNVINYHQSLDKLENISPNDMTFQENIGITKFNVGSGIIFETEHYFIGFSVPTIIKNNLDPSNISKKSQLRQYFLSAGYLFYLNPVYKLKPTIMVQQIDGLSTQVDLNMNLLYNEKLWAGFSYSYNKSVGVSCRILVSRSFGLGISYDFDIGEIRSVNYGSAEILISYTVQPPKKRVINPRYF